MMDQVVPFITKYVVKMDNMWAIAESSKNFHLSLHLDSVGRQ